MAPLSCGPSTLHHKIAVKINNHTIHKMLPSTFQLFHFKQINSNHSNHRIKLRKKLYSEINSLNPSENCETILNLKEPPQNKHWSMSLSHSPMGSAIAIVKKPLLVGVDCEVKDRLNEKIIERISSLPERQGLKNIHWIFSAKEAAWKALNKNHSISLISQIETLDWKTLDNKWIQYKVSIDGQIIDGTGFLYEFSDTYLSFYISPSTFI